ncbi:MAG: hypothetical protein K2U26_05095 [Cyclobacteriaceae bacterium]|nr:hypothetical protein [Cyclobacteriaceae bacterium]
MKHTIFFIILVAIGNVAFAQDNTPRVDARQGAQRARIHEGRKDGDLTNREAAALNAQQRHIRRSERRAKADGTVTNQERAKLKREQNRANRNIRRQKNDAQVKP